MNRTAATLALGAAAALFPIAACGSIGHSPSSSATPSPPPSSSPVLAGLPSTLPGGGVAASVGDADSGRVLQLRRGEAISVTLHQQQGFSQWSRAASSNGSVLTPIPDTRAAAVRGVTLGSFRAVNPGTAQITSSATQQCPASAQCSALAKAWLVTVQVS